MTTLDNAQLAGFDLSLIATSLQRTYEERALDHQAALEFALELEMIGRRQRESAQPPPPDSL
jgi:hypothetical protein